MEKEPIDLQKRRAIKEMFERIRQSLDKEKEPDSKKFLKDAEKDNPNYLKRVK